MKRFTAVLIALTLMLCALLAMPIRVYATENTIGGSKVTTIIDGKERFEVKTQVAWKDGIKLHDEVIVMIDGSYSTDDDWYTIRRAILKIGEKTFENSKGNTFITVMTFGTGDNFVVKHAKTLKQLNEKLPEVPGQLLYGRDFSNGEAGFTGITEYIKNHDDTLNKGHIVYITDGEVNTDETKYVFDNWIHNAWLKKDALTLAKWSIQEELAKYGEGTAKLSNAYLTAFGDLDMASWDEEKIMKWANQVWADVYAYSKMTLGREYAISDTERAFVKYDKENGTHIQEIFYYTTWGRDYPNAVKRTATKGNALAKNEKISHMYMVDINKASTWMIDMASSANNVSIHEAGSISNLLETLDGILTDLGYVSGSEVTVVDYISKWVNLDTSSIRVIDNNSGKTIWTSANGWHISKNRPTSQETPVIVEMLPINKYDDGGPNVLGNVNDVIYKLTWYVKDGEDFEDYNYSLAYIVDVDIHETNFTYNTEYPSNGYSTINYTRKNGDEFTNITKDISSPKVIVNKVETVKPTTPENETANASTNETKPTSTVDETIDINGKVIWYDENNKYETRPEKITVAIFEGEEKVASKKVTEDDNWKYTFKKLPKYNDEGKEIVYTVKGSRIAKYKIKIDGYNIINTYNKPIEYSSTPNDTNSNSGGNIITIVCGVIALGGLLLILLRKKKHKL